MFNILSICVDELQNSGSIKENSLPAFCLRWVTFHIDLKKSAVHAKISPPQIRTLLN